MHVLRILVERMEHVLVQPPLLVGSWTHIAVHVPRATMEQPVVLLIIQLINVSPLRVKMVVFVHVPHRHLMDLSIHLPVLVKVQDFQGIYAISLTLTVLTLDTA